MVRRFAEDHDEGLWSCLCQLFRVLPNQSFIVRVSATAPLTLGGLGLKKRRLGRLPSHGAAEAS